MPDMMLDEMGVQTKVTGNIPKSDGSAYNFEFDNFIGYVDSDGGTGVSSLATEEGESVFKLSTGTGNGTDHAYRDNRSAFTPYTVDNFPVVSYRLKIEDLGGPNESGKVLQIITSIDTQKVGNITIRSDSMQYLDYNGVYQTLAWTPLIGEFFWLEYEIDKSVTPWVANIYINGAPIASDVSFGGGGSFNGRVATYFGNTVDNTNITTYIDKVLIGGAV